MIDCAEGRLGDEVFTARARDVISGCLKAGKSGDTVVVEVLSKLGVKDRSKTHAGDLARAELKKLEEREKQKKRPPG